jgi:hypothetical protein
MKTLGSTCLCAALVLFCASALASTPRGDETSTRATTRNFEDHSAVKRSRAFTMWMAVRSDQVQRWLWEARFKRDAKRMRCLSAKLSQLHAIERLGRTSERAIEAAVRVDALTGHHMVRLVHLHDASRLQLDRALKCGKTISKRVRMRTTSRVRVTRRPALHEAPSL